MDTLQSMRVFHQVVEHLSFSTAARQLNISRAMASKHVMHLETHLGARLLNRNSRHISLTEAGRVYFERCHVVLEDLAEVEATIGRAAVNPRGTIRFTAPIWLATTYFSGLLVEFRTLYPDITFDMDISGRFIDIVEEGFDLALRASRTLSPNLIARPLMSMPFELVAAPDYLRRRGTPLDPAELEQHDVLGYSLLTNADTLNLEGPDGKVTARGKSVLVSNNETLLHAAAVNGMGITLLPAGIVQRDLDSGQLATVLPTYRAPDSPLFAVYTSRRYLSSKVRTFIDFLCERMQA